jgi:signal transduction histidine kinase
MPAIAIQAHNGFARRRARQLEVQHRAISVAKLAAAEQQQIVQGIRQVLIVLSELPPIKTKDSLRCNAYLAAMKPRFPAFITLTVTDLRGLSFCDSSDNHKQVDVSKRAYFANAVGFSAFAVGEFSIGLASKRRVLHFALPFYDDAGNMGGVVIASLGLDWLGDYIASKGASEGGALAIVDRDGTYLARFPNNDRYVGTKMPGEKYLTTDGQATADIVDVDGVERIVGYSALREGSGKLVVSFGLDKARAFDAIRRQTLSDVFLIVLSTSLVLILSSLGARQFVHRPLGLLVDAANQWRLGNFSRRVDIGGNSEIARVGNAFNTMADALEARRLIEEQLQQSQKMEAVGQLTGGVAHDFNNLLAVVSGNLELVQTTADHDKVRQFAAAAQRATDRAAKLTAQLLAFSRRQTLNPKLVNANQLISEFQGLIRQAVGAGCKVKMRTEDRLWLCHVDPSQLETALLNLALNARDAMPDGGMLEIETQNIIVEEGAIAGCLAGPYVRLSVADTGCGMAPEVRDRVFKPFFTTKGVGKGTGLGLSMVYGFVRQSGGHISVESALNVGTTIALHLPRAAQKLHVEEEATQPAAVLTGSERILVVDDNENILEVTSAMLTTYGYQVFCARSGAEALRMIESGPEFEILFSDIVMQDGMSGVELAREAKRLRPSIRILLTSGYARDVLERRNAVDEFPIIDKPFQFSDLAQRLRAILDQA